MFKNENMYMIEDAEISYTNIIMNFCKGADIVFITRDGKIGGGITKGDIGRYEKYNREGIDVREFITADMKYIVFADEEQAFTEARKIFENYWRISNIPVVDESGKLLFQIDRFSPDERLEDILEAQRNESIKFFLESDDIRKIILTGADSVSLKMAKELMGNLGHYMAAAENISLEIMEDIEECFYADEKSKIICLNDNGVLYINQKKGYESAALSAKDLASFYIFSKIEKLDLEAVSDWKHIFEYETVVFGSSNRYFRQLAQIISNCGICVYDRKSFAGQSGDMKLDSMSPMEVLLFSRGGRYCEKIRVSELIEIFELIWRYKQITGDRLTGETYVEAGVACLKALKEEGFEGVLFADNNICAETLKDEIVKKCKLQVANKWEEMLPGKKYVIDENCMVKVVEGCFNCSLRDRILRSVCERAVYELLCKLTEHVYIYPVQAHLYCDYPTYPERIRYNYIHRKEKFSNDFVLEMCGDGNYPLDKVLRDMEDCKTIKINEGYVKFLSNYHSQYFNTDTYGSRVVLDVPEKFSRTIWLIGACNFAGYGVEDKHTFASCLQKKVNDAGYSYRVADLSCEGVWSYDLYNKILDREIKPEDMVIVLEKDFILKEKEIRIDYSEISKAFSGETWYWDTIGHLGYKGYMLLAEKFFDAIKEDMVQGTEDHSFHVEEDLESKIRSFVAEVKGRLKQDEGYRKICLGIDLNRDSFREGKVGAVVMNCNPFTYGHQYLIDTASRLVDLLYVFVVEENKSIFPFEKRFCMVREGSSQFENVVVVPSGKFMISTITFPGYFLKDSPTKECYDTFLDLKIFAHYIAPAFGITTRFVGEEPTDKVTAQYNLDMKTILGDAGIRVIEIPRKKFGKDVISASKVRKLLAENAYAALEGYVPETTMKFLPAE